LAISCSEPSNVKARTPPARMRFLALHDNARGDAISFLERSRGGPRGELRDAPAKLSASPSVGG
jgi:hypothetical protein